MNRDESTGCEMRKIYNSPSIIPSGPKARRPLKNTKENYSLDSSNNNFQSSQMEEKTFKQQNILNPSEAEEESFKSISYESAQMTESSEEDEKIKSLHHSQNHSRTMSPERSVYSEIKLKESIELKPYREKNKQNKRNYFHPFIFIIVIIVIGMILSFLRLSSRNINNNNNKVQNQSKNVNNPTLLLTESIKNLKTTFYNQESDIWSDISSAINEVISRTPKIPSIILLFAEETHTMNCLAIKLASISSDILHADNYLKFNPKDFGNDTGEIITILNGHSSEKKKVVIINDILNINAEAIKALHNLCDRINPLVAEAIYILTMSTNNYQSRQKKLNFVENQIYNKLSKSINQDVLMALVTRITDGVIISVQPEPQLRYC